MEDTKKIKKDLISKDQEEFDKQKLEQEAIENSWKTPSFQYNPKEIVPLKTFEFQTPEKIKYKTLKPDETLNNIVTPDGKSIPTEEYVYNKDFVRSITPEGETKEVCVDDHVYGNSSYDKKSFAKKEYSRTQNTIDNNYFKIRGIDNPNKRNTNANRKNKNAKVPTSAKFVMVFIAVVFYIIVRIVIAFSRF